MLCQRVRERSASDAISRKPATKK